MPSGSVQDFLKDVEPNSVTVFSVLTERTPSVIVILKSSLSNPGEATEIIYLPSSLDTCVFVERVLLIGVVAVAKNGSKNESKRIKTYFSSL